jgi:uncharacterized protein YjiS (DUF1127 family)
LDINLRRRVNDMAFATDISNFESGLVKKMWASLRTARELAGQRRAFRHTLTELSALSERELDDMGITRSMIREIAREAAYKA